MAGVVKGAKVAANVAEVAVIAVGVGVLAYELFQGISKLKKVGEEIGEGVEKVKEVGEAAKTGVEESWDTMVGNPGYLTYDELLALYAQGDPAARLAMMNPLVGLPAAWHGLYGGGSELTKVPRPAPGGGAGRMALPPPVNRNMGQKSVVVGSPGFAMDRGVYPLVSIGSGPPSRSIQKQVNMNWK